VSYRPSSGNGQGVGGRKGKGEGTPRFLCATKGEKRERHKGFLLECEKGVIEREEKGKGG